MSASAIQIVGYGPPGLIQAIRAADWTAAYESGKNFKAISLGGYCLTTPADEHCSLRLVVVVRSGADEFTVTGWSFPSAPIAAQEAIAGEESLRALSGGPLGLAGSSLTPDLTDQNTVRYEIEIKSVPDVSAPDRN